MSSTGKEIIANKKFDLKKSGLNENQPHNKLLSLLKSLEEEEKSTLTFISPEIRKKQGIFFTPSNLVRHATIKLPSSIQNKIYLDPACGTGNLLVEVAKRLEVFPELSATIKYWNSSLYGIDINPAFVELAKKKLISLAVERGSVLNSSAELSDLTALFFNIKAGDFLKEYSNYNDKITDILMNPPFNHTITPTDIKWTSGKLNAAALFIDYSISILPAGGRITAILPDVLRSGSRYEKWRNFISKNISIDFEVFGEFENSVQVDVFLLHGTKESSVIEKKQTEDENKKKKTIASLFNVSIGPVVPHRDKLIGEKSPFAHSKILPPWTVLSELDEYILHSGRKVNPPFIAIRRTSSPKDKNRVIGTIINCIDPVSVENHIIILSPKDQSLETCKKALQCLKSPTVNEFINNQIRCRHLTVGIVKNIPLLEM
ncbi:HsdM family class I SAM-dependent methyltransferase [Chromobacterium piscinae]|uniref:HsdM family class I SAM-dependent methyltransferase n=1 Tax=Chromobacterium piscinae TaxID=686831 RepID=UPI003F80C7BD